MPIDRRHLLLGSLASAGALASSPPVLGLDAARLGVRPGAPNEQSRVLQGAIDQAARSREPLLLAAGIYRAGNLILPHGAQVIGVRGATRIVFTDGPSLFSADGGNAITLSNLEIDGRGQKLPQGRGLVHLFAARSVRIVDCTIDNAGGNAIALEQCEGHVSGNVISGATDNAVFCNDNFGLVISANTIRNCGNGGVRVWQSVKRHDGSIVADNTIEDIDARAGGTGENGNGINVFRAGNVIVRNNIVRRAAFSAIRGNASSNIQIIGNNCAALKETAIYAEFDFEGAIIANNVVDTAENGISVTNFNNGGRLSTVYGNLVRNIGVQRPETRTEDAGIGIGVEAESAVTGNVIEDAASIGIRAGWGPYLRNVAIDGNVVRRAGIGIAVSVAPNAGAATISGNIVSDARLGAIVGMEWSKTVTGDLARDGPGKYTQLTIANNQSN